MSHRPLSGTSSKTSTSEKLSPYSTQLTELEVACGNVLGRSAEPAISLPSIDGSLEPLEALSQAMIPALERSPCLVSFSGGRDSSAILAVAAAVARREGLDLPIPITQRFPHAPESHESDWQELVVKHLNLSDWRILTLSDELDLVGPIAQSVLKRHGVLFPANACTWLPMLQEARGGALLTGIEGDSLFGSWRWDRAVSVLGLRTRPVFRDFFRLGLALAPRRVKKWRMAAKHPLDLPWLKPAALQEACNSYFQWLADEPLRWDLRTRAWTQEKYLAFKIQSYDLIANQAGTMISHPFLDPHFVAALAHRGGRLGFGDRTETMRAVFGDLLPTEVIERRDKASFGAPFLGDHSRALMAQWEGGFVPADLVDEDALRTLWRSEDPARGLTDLLIQSVWVGSSQKRLTQR